MSFLIDALDKWWRVEQKNWTLERVPAPALPPPVDAIPEGQAVVPGKVYLTVRMRSMAIAASRSGWNLFHAALHCETSLLLRNGEAALIQTVLSPDFLRDLDAKHLQRVLHVDRTVFGPVPYIGGALSLNMGVFSVKHADLAAPFLSTLEDLAGVAGVAFISAAAPFVGPIKKGIELLTGSGDDVTLEVAVIREYDPPVTGWYALVRMPGGNLNPGELSIAPGNFELLRGGQPMPGVPYLLFSIDAATTRPDWARIPNLKTAYKDFSDAVMKNKQADAREAISDFNRLARISPELLPTHAEDVISRFGEEYSKVFRGLESVGQAIPSRGHDIARELRGLEVKFRTPA